MSSLPEQYELDYLVYAASSSLSEQKEIWDTDYVEVVKRMCFKKFDGWIEYKYLNRDKGG